VCANLKFLLKNDEVADTVSQRIQEVMSKMTSQITSKPEKTKSELLIRQKWDSKTPFIGMSHISAWKFEG
jgi:hypothetical protein